ncbi:hypothetical protein NQZ68_007546 [Dissostichus eleginoides]|nr:hypothetical protein NQZ68_007546 [Dissostichus eleginoides]
MRDGLAREHCERGQEGMGVWLISIQMKGSKGRDVGMGLWNMLTQANKNKGGGEGNKRKDRDRKTQKKTGETEKETEKYRVRSVTEETEMSDGRAVEKTEKQNADGDDDDDNKISADLEASGGRLGGGKAHNASAVLLPQLCFYHRSASVLTWPLALPIAIFIR